MGARKDAKELTVATKMSRNMDGSLIRIAQNWRPDFYWEEEMTPWFEVDRRDVIEVLLSFIYHYYREPGDIPIWPPRYLMSEHFMERALEQRVEECADQYDEVAILAKRASERYKVLSEEREDRIVEQMERILAGKEVSPDFEIPPMPEVDLSMYENVDYIGKDKD